MSFQSPVNIRWTLTTTCLPYNMSICLHLIPNICQNHIKFRLLTRSYAVFTSGFSSHIFLLNNRFSIIAFWEKGERLG